MNLWCVGAMTYSLEDSCSDLRTFGVQGDSERTRGFTGGYSAILDCLLVVLKKRAEMLTTRITIRLIISEQTDLW